MSKQPPKPEKKRRRKGQDDETPVESPGKEECEKENEVDDEDDEEEEEDKPAKRNKRSKAKAKAKAKSKAKPKEKAKGNAGDKIRDQCKKKLTEIWSQLPKKVQDHISSLDRDSKTDFVNTCIEWEGGKLVPRQDIMLKFITKKEEAQKSLELMAGYCLVDLGCLNIADPSNPPPTTPQR